MRISPKIKHLIEEGSSLSSDGAADLERHLEEHPDDLDQRARLLGYYGISGHDDRLRHAIWLATNAPRAPLAAHPLVHFALADPAYRALSPIWRRHAALEPPDAVLLAHAISFFWSENESFADELLARAEQTLPGDARWASFRRKRRAQEICLADRLTKMSERGLWPNRVAPPSDREESLPERADELEDLLLNGEPDDEWTTALREMACSLSLALGRIDRVRAHAESMLAVEVGGDAPQRQLGDEAHIGHLFLGRLALREGDIDRAKAHLMLAGQAGARGLVSVLGPDMSLARDLLARGERAAVIAYLALCREFWYQAPIDDWTARIRAGEIPDFHR